VVATSFYWFDYETFGISPQWDKPAQFAGIRTDPELNIVGDSLMLYCKPPNDYLPDPEACKVTGLKPGELRQTGLSEPDFISKVIAELGYPGTCSVGYNSIRFDDEFTRHTLYRNFHDPYEYEWKDGNSRWDLLDVVRLTRALRPEGIEWPVNSEGKPSNKLEHLSVANHIQHESAHDALSDVIATIGIAKLIQRRQPKLFQYTLMHRDKQSVATLLNVREHIPCVHVSGMVPADLGHVSIVLPIARARDNQNGVIVLDLRTDPCDLVGLSSEEIAARVFTKGLDQITGERLQLRTLQINKCPVLVPLQTLRDSDAERLGIDKALQIRRAKNWSSLPVNDIIESVTSAMASRPFAPATDTEGNLYGGGFLSAADKSLCEKIRKSSPENLSQFTHLFEDSRYNDLFFRYRGRHFPQTLSEDEAIDWQDHRSARLCSADAAWMTFKSFDEAMARIEWSADESDLVADLKQYRAQLKLAYQRVDD
jgi:exodeoxyribonuclease-1